MPESPDDRVAGYRERVTTYVRQRDIERGKSRRLARLRLATFLVTAGALVWMGGFGGGATAGAVTTAGALVFAVLVVVHARVEEKAEWFDALRTVNERGIARVHRSWDALPAGDMPAALDVEKHPYAADLDLFGRASLFQLLGPAATPAGQRLLARWITAPAAPETVVARQRAVDELAPMHGWREQLAAFGVTGTLVRGESLTPVLEWARGGRPPLPAYGAIQVAVYIIVASMWTLLALAVSGIAPNNWWTVPALAGLVLSFFTAWHVSKALERAGTGERTLHRFASLFALIEGQSFASPRLAELKALFDGARKASRVMAALNRILGFANLRHSTALLHFPIQALTLWDFHCVFALERWRRRSGRHIGPWFEAAGELDALACLAALRHDHPAWCFPRFTDAHLFEARALGHPLIGDSRRVDNDVAVGPESTVLLVTGSNMSGKSTLLRAIGVNAVLAQCGAPVCARALSLPPCDVFTSITIHDSLERGVSYFMAALARLKQVVDAAERETGDRVLLYLLDEVLQGTNSAERAIAVQGIARHLLSAHAIGAMTTHDLNIAGDEPLHTAARLVHFTETIDESGAMHFDYQLRPGLAPSRNALRLMKMIGLEL